MTRETRAGTVTGPRFSVSVVLKEAGLSVEFTPCLSSTKIQLHYEKFNYFTKRYKTAEPLNPLRPNTLQDFTKR